MKKFIIGFLFAAVTGMAIPVLPAFAGNSIKVSVKDSGQLKMVGKNSKKSSSEKNRKTKGRIKKLNQLGVPKSFQKFGDDLTLHEMGSIIAAWIVNVWVNTGQLPDSIVNSPPDWLNVNVNGNCVSSEVSCNRWPNQ